MLALLHSDWDSADRSERRHRVECSGLVAAYLQWHLEHWIRALSQHPDPRDSPRGQMIHETVAAYLDELPVTSLPSGTDAMRLLERIALKDVKFPGPLIMLSKVIFTLDGILRDIGGSSRGMGFTIARHVAQDWIGNRSAFRSPLKTRDWATLQCSALLCSSRWALRAEQAIVNRLLPARSQASQASA